MKVHGSYVKKATTEAPMDVLFTKIEATAARTLRVWKRHTEASHTKAGTHDIQRLAPGLEEPKTPACRIQGRLEIMAALVNLALWRHVQILVERAF